MARNILCGSLSSLSDENANLVLININRGYSETANANVQTRRMMMEQPPKKPISRQEAQQGCKESEAACNIPPLLLRHEMPGEALKRPLKPADFAWGWLSNAKPYEIALDVDKV